MNLNRRNAQRKRSDRKKDGVHIFVEEIPGTSRKVLVGKKERLKKIAYPVAVWFWPDCTPGTQNTRPILIYV